MLLTVAVRHYKSPCTVCLEAVLSACSVASHVSTVEQHTFALHGNTSVRLAPSVWQEVEEASSLVALG